MRDLPGDLAAHLGEGVTTLCRCWRLERRDGVVLGFTDHDRDLAFGGVAYLAGTGFEAAEAAAELGFAVGGGDVVGALSSPGIAEQDVASGLYDDAAVETWLVNWAAPDARLLLAAASVGEIRRKDRAFVAELRGPLHRYAEERGRTYGRTCSAALGDADCRVDLASSPYRAEGAVETTDGAARVAVSGLDGFPSGWFGGGRLMWLSGEGEGRGQDVQAHRAGATGRAELDLWQRSPGPIAVGDAFRVTAGCDKSFATCRVKFANVLNFRGFPHMPGNAYIAKVARQGEPGLDGGSLFR